MLDLSGEIRDVELRWTAPEGNWTVYLLHLSRNYGCHRDDINMMDKRSCRVLIDTVFEPHYARNAQDFGTTIAGFFSAVTELVREDFSEQLGAWCREYGVQYNITTQKTRG